MGILKDILVHKVTAYFILNVLDDTELSLLFSQLEPLGNKTARQDFSTNINLKCPTKVGYYVLNVFYSLMLCSG